MIILDFHERWCCVLANFHRVRTSRVELASSGRIYQVGYHSLDGLQLVRLFSKAGNCSEQALSVWMLCVCKYGVSVSHLANIAGVHDDHPFTNFLDDTEVVCYHHHRKAELSH